MEEKKEKDETRIEIELAIKMSDGDNKNGKPLKVTFHVSGPKKKPS